MSKDRENILFPVGRMVQGSLYEPQTTDADNRPLITKTGVKAGQPRVNYYFALAIPKGAETHWALTDWGKKIYDIANRRFIKGETQRLDFAWKIKDGDSTVPNSKGNKPCDCEGYPGHWVLNFSGGFAPSLVNADGFPLDMPTGAINCGDYIQVYGSVADNDADMKPGIFLNHSHVAFIGYGKRIVFASVDPKTLPWSKQLPLGASPTPLAQNFTPPADTFSSVPPPVAAPIPVQPQVAAPPAPYPQILNTTPIPAAAPPTPVRVMTAKAQGFTYEQFIATGKWDDASLIREGYMTL